MPKQIHEINEQRGHQIQRSMLQVFGFVSFKRHAKGRQNPQRHYTTKVARHEDQIIINVLLAPFCKLIMSHDIPQFS